MTDQLDRLQATLASRYRIEQEIGSGGMATVYLAHDLKHDRKVADLPNVAPRKSRVQFSLAIVTRHCFVANSLTVVEPDHNPATPRGSLTR